MDMPTIALDSQLTPFDYMLYRADMDAHSRTSMMFIETLETTPDIDRLRARVEHATRVYPRLRQRVVAPLLPITAPRWVVDPDFNIDYHFRPIAMSAPGGFRQLLDLAASLHSSPLDLGRPLWEAFLVQGLETPDAQAAILWKLSHTITDGVGGLVLDQALHDETRDPGIVPLPMPSPQDLSSLELTKTGITRLPRVLIGKSVRYSGRAIGTAAQAVRHPVEAISATTRTLGEVRRLAAPQPADPSPALRRRSLNRRFEAIDFELADLRATAKAHGCSVNDAYLTGLAGALRRYHEEMGLPVEALTLAMPVSVRTESSATGGNEWSAVTLPLPLGDMEVERRMQLIREQVLTARGASSINPARLVAPVLAWVPHRLLESSGTGALGIDVQASNVPGHPRDRYLAGARITRTVPIGPLPGVALMVSMVTLAGRCYVGVHYDTASIRDPETFAHCLVQGFSDVAAGVVNPGLPARVVPEATSTAQKAQTTKKTAAAKTTRGKR